MQIRICGVFDR